MSYVLTADARFRVFFSVTTTRGRIQSQYLQLRHIKDTNSSLSLFKQFSDLFLLPSGFRFGDF